jgi:ABC-type multidrug transport system ATPase subunit
MIKLFEVYKEYKGKNVLKGVTFEVKSGDIVTLIGKIGSGKSTIINIICGLLKIDSGKVFIENKAVDFTNRDYIKDIGFILSGDYLIADFSTLIYWDSIGRLLNLKKGHIKERIRFLLELCEISDPNKPISQLSSGNKMLVKVGTMLLNSPKMLIIDEPFNQLDIGEISKIEKILLECQKQGNTIFLTSHYPEPIFRLSDEILLLEDGIIKENIFLNNFIDYNSFRVSLSDYFKKSLS